VALVVIQHLDPRHESALPELLSNRTGMPVVSVEEPVRIRPDHVYVISPNTVLRVRGGRLIPARRSPESFKTIDVFLNSLARGIRWTCDRGRALGHGNGWNFGPKAR
jgi:two-component system CheB/CheR fusion protein